MYKNSNGLMSSGLINYIRWLFFPSRFIFPRSRKMERYLSIPGWETIEFVSSQEELKEINKATGKRYLGGAGNEFLSPLFGNSSVFTMDGDKHRLSRKIVGTSLSKKNIDKLDYQITLLIEQELEKLERYTLTCVGKFTRKTSMKIISSIVLNMNDREDVSTLYTAFEATTGYLANVVSYCKPFWKNKGPLSVGAMVSRRVATIDSIIYKRIRLEQELQKKGPYAGTTTIECLVREQAKHGYDDRFIRDNLVSTIAAGYDTTGAAAMWMLHWFSLHANDSDQSIFEKLRNNPKYIESFVHESLRICPPLEILPRRENDDLDQVGNDRVAKRKPLVCPCPHRVHHDKDIFKNPEEFSPYRFSEKKFTQTEYFPFGAASRLCLGSNLAIKILMSLLTQLVARDDYFHIYKKKFSPVRRNVSIWPSVFTLGKFGAVPRSD